MSYRLALVGGGGIAASHLESIARMNMLQAVAIADVREERARELAGQYGISAYTDYKRMIEAEKPDIAIITLPHFLHRDAAVFAAEHGCHVLLEKPMALNVGECDDIIAAVNRHSVTLMVGHTQHYIRENIEAKKWIDSGILGDFVMITDSRHVNYNRPERPDWFFEKAKAGGGIMTNLGSHSVDKIQWLTGSPIAKVRASIRHGMGRGDVEGGGMAFLQTKSGIPAVISQSGFAGAPRNETELMFTKGMIKLLTGESLWVSQGGGYRQIEPDKGEAPFQLQFRELVDCIESGREPECSMAYSRSIVNVVESMYRSSDQEREIIIDPEK